MGRVLLQGQGDRYEKETVLTSERGRGGCRRQNAPPDGSKRPSGAPRGRGEWEAEGVPGRGRWPQPSCARAHLSGRAGATAGGAAPGPRPSGDSRERGPRAHSADAPTAGERSGSLQASRVSRGSGWRRGRTGRAPPGYSRRALCGGNSDRDSPTGVAGRAGEYRARSPGWWSPSGAWLTPPPTGLGVSECQGVGPVGSPPGPQRTFLLFGPNKQQVKLNLLVWLRRQLRDLPVSTSALRSPSRSASGTRAAWSAPARAPPASLGRAGTIFKKCFSKA